MEFKLEHKMEFLPDIDEMAGAMKSADIAFFCNPGNPSGRALGREAVIKLIKAAGRARCLLVVDEAFMEWAAQYDQGPPFTGRSLVRHEAWLGARSCEVLRLVGDLSVSRRCDAVMETLGTPGLEIT